MGWMNEDGLVTSDSVPSHEVSHPPYSPMCACGQRVSERFSWVARYEEVAPGDQRARGLQYRCALCGDREVIMEGARTGVWNSTLAMMVGMHIPNEITPNERRLPELRRTLDQLYMKYLWVKDAIDAWEDNVWPSWAPQAQASAYKTQMATFKIKNRGSVISEREAQVTMTSGIGRQIVQIETMPVQLDGCFISVVTEERTEDNKRLRAEMGWKPARFGLLGIRGLTPQVVDLLCHSPKKLAFTDVV